MHLLGTIWYEGASIESVTTALKHASIDIIIDVRERAQSRRKGFSKSALAAALGQVGIKYVHMRDLGDPKAGRIAARAGRFGEFRRIFQKHLKTTRAQVAMDEALSVIANSNACLLCYERDEAVCHRQLIVEEMANRAELRVVHLRADIEDRNHFAVKVWHRTGPRTRQGASAA